MILWGGRAFRAHYLLAFNLIMIKRQEGICSRKAGKGAAGSATGLGREFGGQGRRGKADAWAVMGSLARNSLELSQLLAL